MNNLFKGLEDLGFEDIPVKDIFLKKEEKPADDKAKKDSAIAAVLFKRSLECPVCDKNFENSFLRSTKLRLIQTDSDLRSTFEPLDPLYYDVLLCPHCGYSSMSSSFNRLTDKQKETIFEKISPKFKQKTYSNVYTPDEAIERYKLALLCATVKGAKNSEKAYLCLKLTWLSRDKGDGQSEKMYLENAFSGFKIAYETEGFPIASMDENTLCYLLGELARRVGKTDEALKYLSKLLIEKNVSVRLKERAYQVRDMIKDEKRKA